MAHFNAIFVDHDNESKRPGSAARVDASNQEDIDGPTSIGVCSGKGPTLKPRRDIRFAPLTFFEDLCWVQAAADNGRACKCAQTGLVIPKARPSPSAGARGPPAGRPPPDRPPPSSREAPPPPQDRPRLVVEWQGKYKTKTRFCLSLGAAARLLPPLIEAANASLGPGLPRWSPEGICGVVDLSGELGDGGEKDVAVAVLTGRRAEDPLPTPGDGAAGGAAEKRARDASAGGLGSGSGSAAPPARRRALAKPEAQLGPGSPLSSLKRLGKARLEALCAAHGVTPGGGGAPVAALATALHRAPPRSADVDPPPPPHWDSAAAAAAAAAADRAAARVPSLGLGGAAAWTPSVAPVVAAPAPAPLPVPPGHVPTPTAPPPGPPPDVPGAEAEAETPVKPPGRTPPVASTPSTASPMAAVPRPPGLSTGASAAAAAAAGERPPARGAGSPRVIVLRPYDECDGMW